MSTDLSPLFEASEPRRIDAGAFLFHSGDAVQAMYLVLDGTIDLIRVSGDGAIIILQRAGPGQVLAEASAYSDRYHCDARAVGAARVAVVPVRRFLNRLASAPDLAGIWAAYLARAVQAARLRAEIRSLRTVAERLEAWLASGRALPQKGDWQDLAFDLGVTREALYRELARRRKDKSAG